VLFRSQDSQEEQNSGGIISTPQRSPRNLQSGSLKTVHVIALANDNDVKTDDDYGNIGGRIGSFLKRSSLKVSPFHPPHLESENKASLRSSKIANREYIIENDDEDDPSGRKASLPMRMKSAPNPSHSSHLQEELEADPPTTTLEITTNEQVPKAHAVTRRGVDDYDYDDKSVVSSSSESSDEKSNSRI